MRPFGIKKILLIRLIADAAALALVYYGAKEFTKRTKFPSSQIELKDHYSRWLHDPVDVSYALEIEPPSPLTVQAGRLFAEALGDLADEDPPYRHSDELARIYERNWIWAKGARREPELDMKGLEERIVRLEPLLSAFETLVARPDFSLDTMASFEDFDRFGTLPLPRYWDVGAVVKVLGLRSRIEASKGDYDAAFSTCFLMFQAARTRGCSGIIATLTGFRVQSVATKNWMEIATECEDARSVRESLNAVNEHAAELCFLTDQIPIVSQWVASGLVAMRRRGIEVAMENKTGKELFIELTLARIEVIETRIMSTLAPGDDQYEALEDTVRSLRLHVGWMNRQQGDWITRRTPRFLHDYGRARLFCSYFDIPVESNFETQEQVVMARLDLARIEAARHLYMLEHGEAPATIEALAPEYLPQAPADRFSKTGSGYRWGDGKSGKRMVYSIGPDGIDDRALVQYDGTGRSRWVAISSPPRRYIEGGDLFFAVED